jgi:hypothetical protein
MYPDDSYSQIMIELRWKQSPLSFGIHCSPLPDSPIHDHSISEGQKDHVIKSAVCETEMYKLSKIQGFH